MMKTVMLFNLLHVRILQYVCEKKRFPTEERKVSSDFTFDSSEVLFLVHVRDVFSPRGYFLVSP